MANNYYRQNPNNPYARYLDMDVYIQNADYEQYKFKTIFCPRKSKDHIDFEQGEIHYNNLLHLLSNAKNAKNYLNWNAFLQISKFDAPKPKIHGLLLEPQKPNQPVEPIYDDINPKLLKIREKPCYKKPNIDLKSLKKTYPKLASFIDFLIIQISKIWFVTKLAIWKNRLNKIEKLKMASKWYEVYKQNIESYKENLINYNHAFFIWSKKHEEYNKKYNEAISVWLDKKADFDAAANFEYKKILNLKNNYEKKDKHAIEKLIRFILLLSPYPSTFPRKFKINYDIETQIIVIDFQLPDFERINIVEAGKQYNFKQISKTKRKEIIESTLPAIALRTLYEVAVNDELNFISSIVFNGWINFIDKTNGNERNEYILSVHAVKDNIKKIVIDKVDPKECFKSLKGVVAKNLIEYIPVAPILVLNKKDNRIIEGREIMKGLAQGDNLAAMDWNDFEHLIRELFEKEFSKFGAEVKITHASHDRGVDAIVYDPDPIRGGKFIIQAKRYTKLVDVSAVRDLYGAIQNENANRGILVTTSHYGPDAYEFAKNKNITLLTGENLLHMLEKHGYKFRIDIKEARKLFNLKEL